MLRAVSGPTEAGSEAYLVPQPRRGEVGQLVWESLCFSAPAGYRPLFLDLHVPRPSATVADTAATEPPLVVWLHGGGWEQGSRRRFPVPFEEHWLLERILLAGLAVALVDYRLVREADFPAPVDDVRHALGWLRSHAQDLGVDPDRIALWGESAGAHLALLAVAHAEERQEPRVQAVVDWYGPTDLPALMRSTRATAEAGAGHAPEVDLGRAMYDEGWDSVSASPLLVLGERTPPLFIAHGRDDETVPLSQSTALRDRLAGLGAPVELLETEGGHVFEGAEVLPTVLSRSLDFVCAAVDVERGPHPDSAGDRASVHAPVSPASVAGDLVPGMADEQIPVRVLGPDRGAGTVVVYLDGRASSIRDLDRQRPHAERIAAAVPATVLQLACGQAPGRPFATVVEECVRAAAGVPGKKASPGATRLIVAGDGGSASLAVATARRCRDDGVEVHALFLDQGVQTRVADLPAASAFGGLCPVLLGTGALSPFFEDVLVLVRRLREAGVATRLRIFPSLGDDYAGATSRLATADSAVQQMCRDLSQFVWDGSLG